MNLLGLPGLSLIGYIKADNVNNGAPVPLFRIETPPGAVSINTVSGWNTAAEKQNRRSFKACFGRDPVSDSELWDWVDSQL